MNTSSVWKNHIRQSRQERILLILLPFWTPLIPPLGISCIKSFLQEQGYLVKTADLNVAVDFKQMYDDYFEVLKDSIPESKRGNLYNIGHDVLDNHMMAHLNRVDDNQYIELVKTLIFKNFLVEMGEGHVFKLNEVVGGFYGELEKCFLDLLEKEKPTILGLSVYRGTLSASMFTCKLTREKYPHIMTVMGGAIFSQSLEINSKDFEFFNKQTPYIDKILVGEGEILFHKLLRGELPASQKVLTLRDIGNETLNISSVKPPDFSDFNLRFYPYLAAYGSRSCPFQCNFCAETIYWGKYRKKSTQQVVRELTALYQKYGSQMFLMCDSLLDPIIMDLAGELIKSGHSIYWDGYLRINKQASSTENTVLWRRAGFYRARLGVESGSQYVLDLMNKKISPDLIISSLASLANAGIKTTTYWIVGYPNETEEDFQQTLDLLEKCQEYIYEAECNPFRFFLTGQVESNQFTKEKKAVALYPESARSMLLTQTWTLDCQPSREETLKRINRFAAHCNKLGIPNPYSLVDICKADDRWQNLHENAVPPLIEFIKPGSCISESKNVRHLFPVDSSIPDKGDFDFEFEIKK